MVTIPGYPSQLDDEEDTLSQDPQKKQEPGQPPAASVGQSQGQGQPAAQSASQQPIAPVNPPALPANSDQRLERMLKGFADVIKQGRRDDRNRVVWSGYATDEEAYDRALDELEKLVTQPADAVTPSGAEQVHAYLRGGPLPKDWLPWGADPVTLQAKPAKSQETRDAEMQAFQGEAMREQMDKALPGLSIAYDYVIDPLGGIIPAAIQPFASLYAGLTNADRVPDVKATIHSALRPILAKVPLGLPGRSDIKFGDVMREDAKADLALPWRERADKIQAQLGGIEESASAGSAAARGAGKLGGELLAYLWGGGVSTTLKGAGGLVGKAATAFEKVTPFLAWPNKIMGIGGKVGGAIGRGIASKVESAAGKALIEGAAHGAGSFGALEAASARGSKTVEAGPDQGISVDAPATVLDRLEALGLGGIKGMAIGAANVYAKHVYHGLYKVAKESLGKTEAEQLGALEKWADKAGVKGRIDGETDQGYATRLANSYVDAGMPGAPPMPVRKFWTYAKMGGIQALSFRAVDAHFWSDVIEGGQGDGKKLARAMASLVGDTVTLGLAQMPSKDFVPWQRAQRDPEGALLKDQQAQEAAKTEAAAAEQRGAQELEAARNQAREAHLAEMADITARANAAAPENRQAIEQERADASARHKAEMTEITRRANEAGQAQEQAAAQAKAAEEASAAQERAASREQMTLEQKVVDEMLAQDKSQRQGQPEADRLRRVGWGLTTEKPGDPRSFAMETEPALSFTVDGDVAKPSQALRERLGGLPESVPAKELIERIEAVSLISDMATLRGPGEQLASSPSVIMAVEGDASTEGKAYTMRLGQAFEGELRAGAEMKPVAELPKRVARDLISPQQEKAVSVLKDAMTDEQLGDTDRALLGSIIETLDTVDVRNSPGVKDLMDSLILLLERTGAERDPAQTSQTIWTAARILANQAPEIAMANQIRAELEQGLAEERMAGEGGAQEQGKQPPAEPPAEPQQDAAAFDAEAAGQAAAEAAGPGQLGSKPDTGNQAAARVDAARAIVDDLVESGQAGTKAHKEAVAELRAAIKASVPEGYYRDPYSGEVKLRPTKPGESGFLDVKQLYEELVRRPLRALREKVAPKPGMPLKTAIILAGAGVSLPLDSPAARKFAEALIEEVRRRVPEAGAKGFRAEAKIREKLKDYEQLLARLPKTRVRSLEKTQAGEATESGEKALYSRGLQLKESDLRERFKIDPKDVTAEERAVLKTWNELTRLIRTHASQAGMQNLGRYTPEGELAQINPDTNRDVMPRIWVPEISDQLRNEAGPDYMPLMRVIAKENGKTVEQVQQTFRDGKGFTDARGVRRLDPIENMRQFKFIPDFYQRADGSIQRLLESRPLQQSKLMAHGAAKRIGTVEVYGQDLPGSKSTPELIEMLTKEGLPVPYIEEIAKADPEHRLAVASMLRALMGMPTERAPDTSEARAGWTAVGKLVGAVNDVAAALRMTYQSVVNNLTESAGTSAAVLGRNRIGQMAAEVTKAVSENRIAELVSERQQAGGFSLVLPEYMSGGEKGVSANLLTLAKTAREFALNLFHKTQAFTDLVVHKALFKAVEGWREGTQQSGDVEGLQTAFGFTEAQAKQIVDGKADSALYRAIELNGLTRLTRRGDLPVNQSKFARSRDPVTRMVKFTHFFQRRTADLQMAGRMMRDAETPEQAKAAARNFAKLVGFNVASYFAAQTIIKGLSGWDELMGYWHENLEEATGQQGVGGALHLGWTALVGSMLGAPGAVLGQGLAALFGGKEDDKKGVLSTLGGAVPGLGAAFDMAEYAGAQWHNLTGTAPAADSPYSGKTPLQQLGQFVGSQVPLVRWAENGPLGLGINYLGTDPQLEAALRASRRVSARLGIQSDHTTGGDDKFLDTMRKAVTKLRGDEDPGDVAELVREAMPDQKDSTVAASLMARRALSGPAWEELSEEQQASKLRSLGEKRVELLRGYDAVLERTALYFRHRRRRRL